MSQPPSESSYGQTAAGLGFVTDAQVRECLDIQAKMREMGIDEPLGEVLVKKRYLTPQQHQQVLKKLGVHTNPIPGYTLHAKIGQGGMGTVYKATQTSVNRLVAVKVLAAQATKDPAFVARFFQEARAAGKLSHKNLIAAIDVGEASGLYYFVMEFVTGRSGRQILNADGPFDGPRALDLAIQMAEVLDYIHQNRLVHRDIKPENILFTPEGVVKLCDLGLAKSTVAEEQSLTQSGVAVGTPYFMSPEQCRGDKDVDIRADLYSLGATLFFLVTGRHPFEGKSALETMNLHLTAPVPDPRKLAPGVHEDFARLIQTLMAKDRADRYASPAELLEDLVKIRSGAAPARARQQAARAHLLQKTHSTARAPASRRASRAPLFAGIAVAAVALGVVAVALPGSKPPPAPPAVARAPERAAPPPPPKTDSTPAALVRAREAGSKDPNDLAGLIPLYERAVLETRGTPFADESRRVLDGLYRRELDQIDVRARESAQREEFGSALAVLEAARARRAAPEWTSPIDARIADLRGQAAKLFATVRDAAVAARRRGAEDEAVRASDRVARWGLSEHRQELERSLTAAVPEPPKAVPATDPALKAWETAVRLGGLRDYAGAAAALERVSPPDAELLRAAGAVLAEAVQALSKLPRGQKLTLQVFDESGALQTIDDTVLRADPLRIELQGGGVVDVGEIAAESIAEVWRARTPRKAWKDGRAAALLCFLEGDPSAPRSELSEKWGAAPKRADGPREQEARKTYYGAERDFADPAETADAVRRFRSLLSESADTAFVRRNRAAVASRAEGGREFFFVADDLKASGTFRPAAAAKGPACLTSEADSDPSKRAENFVEIAFSVLEGSEYRAWAYVGGCCLETMGFHLQASDAPDPTGAPPQPVKHGLSVTKTHSSHGGAKQASRWGWVALALPKYSSAGTRRVRLLTDQKGFSVAYGFVSSVKAAPPRDAEVKDLEKARVEAAARVAPDPGLVGWWKLDDRGGAVATDATRNRNHGALRNGPAWTAGKLGGALQFDGADDHVRIPDSPSINTIGAQMTAAFWIERQANQADYRLVVSRQLATGDENQFWLGFDDNDSGFSITTTKGMREVLGKQAPNGEWIHLAGTYDGTTARLYVNGVEAASAAQGGPLAASTRSLVIGGDEFDDKGSIQEVPRAVVDDVRLYNRALGAAEVAALAATRPR